MKKSFLLLAFTMLVFSSNAQWPSHPDQSLLVATGTDGGIAITVNQSGECFISIPRVRMIDADDPSAGLMHDLYLQKLTPTGELAWDAEVLATSKYNDMGGYKGALIATKDGGAVATFYESSASYMLIAHVCKINGDGTKAWEVQVSENSSTESYLSSELLELPNGDIIVAVERDGNNVLLQKIKPDGTVVWPALKEVQASDSQFPLFGKLGLADGNNFFVTYATFLSWSNGNIRAQKFDSDGNALWPTPVELHTAGRASLRVGINRPVHDGDGGMTFQLTYMPNMYQSMLIFQQVNAAGELRYPGQGLVVAQSTTKQYTSPLMSFHKPREMLLLAYRTGNLGWGINKQGFDMQRVSLVSDRMEWGIEGKATFPMIADQDVAPGIIVMDSDENPIIVYLKTNPDDYFSTAILAKKLDLNGIPLWDDDVVISDYSNKTFSVLTPIVNGQLVTAWCSDGSVYAQRFLIRED